MNSRCEVQSKRNCESHESCVCIAGFSACGCQKKSVVYETQCRHVDSLERQAGPEPFIALKHIQANLYLIRSEMGSQCSSVCLFEMFCVFFLSRKGIEWW